MHGFPLGILVKVAQKPGVFGPLFFGPPRIFGNLYEYPEGGSARFPMGEAPGAPPPPSRSFLLRIPIKVAKKQG